MSSTPLYLPQCLADGFALMFPTLDLDAIDFEWDPTVGADGHLGLCQSFVGRTLIKLNPGLGEVCSTEVFGVLAHELVHALQTQSSGLWANRITSIVCGLLRGKMDAGNCLEREAYEFEARARGLGLGDRGPCLCGPANLEWLRASGLPFPNPAFPDVATLERSQLVKREAGCTPWDCVGDGILDRVLGAIVVAAAAIVATVGHFWDGTFYSYAGIAIGGTTGLAIGFASAGIPGAIIGALVGAFLGGLVGFLLSSLATWIFGGGEGGSLNVRFSTDEGATFGDKATFERSEEPMALAFGPDRMAIAWVGTDDQVNLITVPAKTRASFEQSESSGPALVQDGARLEVGWQGRDNRLNLISTWDGMAFRGKGTIPETTLDDATMGLAWGNASVFISWIGRDNRINLARSDNAYDWGDKIVLNEECENAGTVALAWQGGKLHAAWVGTDDDHRLNILEIDVHPNGSMTTGHKTTLLQSSSADAGPALAALGQRLYLAWTGLDHHVNIMVSLDGGHTFGLKSDFEQSRSDCGPALAVHEDGTVCIGWIGRD